MTPALWTMVAGLLVFVVEIATIRLLDLPIPVRRGMLVLALVMMPLATAVVAVADLVRGRKRPIAAVILLAALVASCGGYAVAERAIGINQPMD